MSESSQTYRHRLAEVDVVVSDHHSPGGMLMAFVLFVLTLVIGGLNVLLVGLGTEQWLLVALGAVLAGTGLYATRKVGRRNMIGIRALSEAAYRNRSSASS